ncbi:MAG: class II fructose-bisphosphate aldolase [Parcubacteria group bacterium]|jgi:fructose-bisphosphate aldolase class II
MITSVKEILTKAREGGYAVGAFNTVNLETTRAIVDAAKEMRSPVIIQITERTMEYAGGRMIYNIVKNDVEFYAPEIPVGIHLDHGKSFEATERCTEIGFGSVMYDGSRAKFEDNIRNTKKVVDSCHGKGVDVQGELGSVLYIGETEGGEINWDDFMTDPQKAAEFVKSTGVDALAVAIGNSHGFLKERPTPDFERLKKINELCNIPLILHGASDWENGKVVEAIKNGISCFNVDTAIRVAFVSSLINSLKGGSTNFDVRKILEAARESVKETVKQKIKYFGSEGKA